MKLVEELLVLCLFGGFSFIDCVRPAFEDDPELCPFTNRLTINDLPAEMTPKIKGMKYFRRTNESREEVTMDKANALCRMYNLEAAEILDQDDYNEVIAIVKETDWSFWINVKGKYTPEFGNYNFDFTLADGHTRIGFHDFGPESFMSSDKEGFIKAKEGCVIIEPNGAHPSGVGWGREKCDELNNILCQYKKSCYRRSDYMKDPTRPIKRLASIPLYPQKEESGFVISTHQATWPFARQVCEDADMQLLWFDNDAEQDTLRNILTINAENRVQYRGKSFWTAGRFSPGVVDGKPELYAKLYWWKHNIAYEVSQWDLTVAQLGQTENSGGFLKKWGKEGENTDLDKNEPYDEGLQGIERCVDASFTGDGGEYYTSKCDKRLRYFICKKPDVVRQAINHLGTAQKPSFMAYCDGAAYKKTRAKDCNGEIIFSGRKKPDCTYYNGVHGLMADVRCSPKLLVGNGCMTLKAKSSLHWRILPADIVSDNKPWIIVVNSGDERNELYTWFYTNSHEATKRQILGSATFFFFGYDLYRDEGSDDLCFVVNTNALNETATEFYEYSVTDLPSISMRHYFYQENCDTSQVPEEELIIHEISVDKNDCSLKCDDGSGNGSNNGSGSNGGGGGDGVGAESDIPVDTKDNKDEVFIEIPSKMEHDCNDDSCNDIHSSLEGEGGQILAKKANSAAGKTEGDIEDINDNLNRQLLVHAIEMAFPYSNGPGDSTMTGPKNTWIILEKLFELAKETCGKMVSQNFLSRVLKYFKIAHYGENYEYGEYFSDAETKQILSMLDICRERSYKIKEMDVEVDSCTGRASRQTLENKTREIISRSSDDTGYQTVFHHHVVEATWDVIDLWNAVCITEFKPSYLLFHHMERGMEILFTEKLRKLWHFPNVTEDYYKKLLGPDEGIQLLNLDQCILAAYKGNMRTHRMNRPLKGRTTVVGQMIRNRLEDRKLKEEGVVSTNIHTQAKVLTACIRGNTVRCHKKQTAIKKPVGSFLDIMNKG